MYRIVSYLKISSILFVCVVQIWYDLSILRIFTVVKCRDHTNFDLSKIYEGYFQPTYNLVTKTIAVVRQQFVLGINCSTFLYRNSFRANQRLANTRKSFRICIGFTLCSLAGLAAGECSTVMGLTPCMLCVHIYCVLCVVCIESQLWIQDWVGLLFWKPLCLLSTLEGLATTDYQLT